MFAHFADVTNSEGKPCSCILKLHRLGTHALVDLVASALPNNPKRERAVGRTGEIPTAAHVQSYMGMLHMVEAPALIQQQTKYVAAINHQPCVNHHQPQHQPLRPWWCPWLPPQPTLVSPKTSSATGTSSSGHGAAGAGGAAEELAAAEAKSWQRSGEVKWPCVIK